MKRLTLILLPLLAACSSLPSMPSMPSMPSLPSLPSMPSVSNWVSPYKIDVRQGNYVTQEMVSQLKPGMSKDQVRYALGTPLITDIFHGERWDYVYRFQPGKGELEERKIAIFFEQGKLLRLAGDVIPAAGDKAALPATASSRVIEIAAPAGSLNQAPVEAAKPAGKSWFDKIWPDKLWPF